MGKPTYLYTLFRLSLDFFKVNELTEFLMSVPRFLFLPVKGLIPNLPLLNHHALPTLPPSRLILQWQPLICPSLPFHTHFHQSFPSWALFVPILVSSVTVLASFRTLTFLASSHNHRSVFYCTSQYHKSENLASLPLSLKFSFYKDLK